MQHEAVVSGFAGQGWTQIGELLLAFVLATSIGLERQLRGKAAGLRTQAIVGTTAALLLLVSKYGFSDVLVPGQVILDPSRVAAQIVSGVGFLGAGLILTRGGAVRGLTTAAAVWETAAIGMAAGAGLWLLALIVTALHFVITFGFTAIRRSLPGGRDTGVHIEIVYLNRHGVLRQLLSTATASGWRVDRLTPRDLETEAETSVEVELTGRAQTDDLVSALSALEGVRSVAVMQKDELD